MPRHDGIRMDIVEAAEPPGAGYLLMLIERSERRPHRAELGVGRYFKRSGDSTIRMEHYDIEDSFKRLVVPSLEIRTEVPRYGTRNDWKGHTVIQSFYQCLSSDALSLCVRRHKML